MADFPLRPPETTELAPTEGRGVRTIVDEVRERMFEGVDPEELRELIAELHAALDRRVHDDSSEGGVLHETVYEAPWLTRQAESLRRQLHRLREEAAQMDEHALDVDDDPNWWPFFRLRFDDFFEELIDFENGLHNLRFNAIEGEEE